MNDRRDDTRCETIGGTWHPGYADVVPFRIACWPDDRTHPYQVGFYRALEVHGVQQVAGLVINDESLRQLRPSIDAVHFHWPEYVWRVGVRHRVDAVRRLAGFRRFLNLCHRLDLRIIWTAHNLNAHESTWLDRLGLGLMGRRSDLIIAHSDRVQRLLSSRLRTTVITMPQGNYDGFYPEPRPRAQVLEELNLTPDKPTLSLVGALRPYKGVDQAIDAVAQFGGAVQLIVAGTPKPGFDLAALLARRASAPWLTVVARPLNDQEFSDITCAGTALLLPYTRLTTSGVLLAGWSLSRTAITSPEPYFLDLFEQHPEAGIAAEDVSPSAMAAAIERHLAVPETERWSAARRAADAYAWSKCVEPVAQALANL